MQDQDPSLEIGRLLFRLTPKRTWPKLAVLSGPRSSLFAWVTFPYQPLSIPLYKQHTLFHLMFFL